MRGQDLIITKWNTVSVGRKVLNLRKKINLVCLLVSPISKYVLLSKLSPFFPHNFLSYYLSRLKERMCTQHLAEEQEQREKLRKITD